MSIDYRELLMKYIEHVGECEGITFIRGGRLQSSAVPFTDAEVEEMEKLDQESKKYNSL